MISFQVEVEFGNGSVFNLSAEFLRVHSPAVDAKIRSIGGEKAITLSHLFLVIVGIRVFISSLNIVIISLRIGVESKKETSTL